MNLKKLLLLPLMALLLLPTGCRKEYITYGSQVHSHFYTVKANQWVKPANANYYVSRWENADITPDVVDANGAVVAYVFNNGTWCSMPYVYPYYSADYDVTIAENYRLEYSEGYVYFILEDLDGALPEYIENLPDVEFKVSVIK